MTILVGYKGANVGQDLLALAQTHAEAFKCNVFVVTSMKEGEQEDQARINAAESNLEQAQAFFKGRGIDCKTHLLIRGMEPWEDIVSFAKEKNVKEILIGVKSRSKVGKILFGSTAQSVIINAPCPVVSVR